MLTPTWAQRLDAQLLGVDRATTVLGVTGRLLAVQAQDLRGARLAVRARSEGLTAYDVDAALSDRSCVVSWLNRGTLHLVSSEDHHWLHALTTPQLRTGNHRRLQQEGVTLDQAEATAARVRRWLADGPLTRAELRSRVASTGVPVERQALVHLLFYASLRGICVRGPVVRSVVGSEQAWVLREDWLGPTPGVDRERALGWLGKRYLAAHAPADDRDLAQWAGITLGDARRGLAAAGAPVPAQPPPRREGQWPPRLLGPWDDLLLGWAERSDVVGEHRQLITSNGIFKPVVLVDGRAVGTWSVARLELDLFETISGHYQAALDRELEDVRRFLSSPSVAGGR